ncbi:MAG: NifU family protein, partial [Desulfobacterales bacterium]
GGCGNCHDRIQEIIDSILGTERPAAKKKAKLSNIQKIKLIEETLEREIKPALQKDGGGIELVDVDGNTVMVRLCGTCAACNASQVTLKNYVETKLQELVTPELVVEEVA